MDEICLWCGATRCISGLVFVRGGEERRLGYVSLQYHGVLFSLLCPGQDEETQASE